MLHNTDLFNAIDETWPPRTLTKLEDWIIREGCGGGQRVSATSGSGDIVAAEKAMIALGQNKLFMVGPKILIILDFIQICFLKKEIQLKFLMPSVI